MKKILFSILACTVSAGFIGCGKEDEPDIPQVVVPDNPNNPNNPDTPNNPDPGITDFSVSIESKTVSFQGEEFQFQVSVDHDYKSEITESSDPSNWISLKYYTSGRCTLVNVEPNTSLSPRSCKIVVSIGEVKRSISVTQEACPCELQISAATVDFTADGGKSEVQVTAPFQPQFSKPGNANWLSYSYEKTGDYTGVLRLTCNPNEEKTPRSCELQIKSRDQKKTVTISQEALIALELLNPENLSVPFIEGSAALLIYTNLDASVHSSANWAKPRPMTRYGNYQDIYLLNIDCEANYNHSQRTADITLKAKEKTITFTLTQSEFLEDYFKDGTQGADLWENRLKTPKRNTKK